MAGAGRTGEGFLEEVLRARKLMHKSGTAAGQQRNEKRSPGSMRERSRSHTS